MAVTEADHAAARAADDLYRRHGSDVYRYALAVLGNPSDAEDVTQTTFLNAYRSLEQGVRPRKPANWLLTIASNTIKQRFRQEKSRPRQVTLDDRIAHASPDDDAPTVGELLTALSRIPPQQRQAIVLREFEGRSYKEIAGILEVTTSALETLLFRARRSLAEELEHHLTCTEAQLAISRAVDGRLGRKERRRLREHLDECPDCARFARVQQRHRQALRGLLLVPVPLSLTLFKGLEGSASAATLPTVGANAAAIGSTAGLGAATATGGGALAGGLTVKAAAVVVAASLAGGVGVVGSTGADPPGLAKSRTPSSKPGMRLGQTAPRGVLVPGLGVAVGKARAPGQSKAASSTSTAGGRSGQAQASGNRAQADERAHGQSAQKSGATPRRDGPTQAQLRGQSAGKRAPGQAGKSTRATSESRATPTKARTKPPKKKIRSAPVGRP